MADLPDSLFLSDRLMAHYVQYNDSLYHKAAAELRRLAGIEAERDALKQTLHDELDGNLRLRELGGARPDEPFTTFIERVIAERDALLSLIADDAFASSFQTMAQYRSALLNSVKAKIQ